MSRRLTPHLVVTVALIDIAPTNVMDCVVPSDAIHGGLSPMFPLAPVSPVSSESSASSTSPSLRTSQPDSSSSAPPFDLTDIPAHQSKLIQQPDHSSDPTPIKSFILPASPLDDSLMTANEAKEEVRIEEENERSSENEEMESNHLINLLHLGRGPNLHPIHDTPISSMPSFSSFVNHLNQSTPESSNPSTLPPPTTETSLPTTTPSLPPQLSLPSTLTPSLPLPSPMSFISTVREEWEALKAGRSLRDKRDVHVKLEGVSPVHFNMHNLPAPSPLPLTPSIKAEGVSQLQAIALNPSPLAPLPAVLTQPTPPPPSPAPATPSPVVVAIRARSLISVPTSAKPAPRPLSTLKKRQTKFIPFPASRPLILTLPNPNKRLKPNPFTPASPPPPPLPIPSSPLSTSSPPPEDREARKFRLLWEQIQAREQAAPSAQLKAQRSTQPFPPPEPNTDLGVLTSAARHAAALAAIPSAPLLTPTVEQFADPMRYIREVVNAHAQYGVVMIKPPEGWRPRYEYRLEGEGGKFACKRQVLKRYGGLDEVGLQVSSLPHSAEMTLTEVLKEGAIKEKEWEGVRTKWKHKASKFNSPPPQPTTLRPAEDEYWRWAMYYGKDKPSILYANDVDTSPEQRTPLPSPPSSSPSPLYHPWDLSTLNRLPNGLLHHLDRVIPGITDPMLYIGVTFSTFCWHHEDHHLYSISYNHRGQPKTWYGVPGSHCQEVERVARDDLYPFFDHQRDHILARKTSMFSPVLLHQRKVPVYRAEQAEGMFVITFPRAYHSGFSHGFSLAESVNFALDDWLEAGYEATGMYRRIGKFPVVPYHELMMKVVEGVVGGEGENAKDVRLLERLEDCFARVVWDELKERERVIGKGRVRIWHEVGRRVTRYCDLCQHAMYYTWMKREGEKVCLGHGKGRVREGEVVMGYSSVELITVLSDVQARLMRVKKEKGEEGGEEEERKAQVRNGRFDACVALATALSDREGHAVEVTAMETEEEEEEEIVVGRQMIGHSPDVTSGRRMRDCLSSPLPPPPIIEAGEMEEDDMLPLTSLLPAPLPSPSSLVPLSTEAASVASLAVLPFVALPSVPAPSTLPQSSVMIVSAPAALPVSFVAVLQREIRARELKEMKDNETVCSAIPSPPLLLETLNVHA